MEIGDINADILGEEEGGEVNADPAQDLLNADPTVEAALLGDAPNEEGDDSAADAELNSSELGGGLEDGVKEPAGDGGTDTDDALGEPDAKKVRLDADGDETLDGSQTKVTPVKAEVNVNEPTAPEPKSETGTPDTDMLSTLACAALNQDEKTPEKKDEPTDQGVSKKRSEMWHNVGIFTANNTVVTDYFAAMESSQTIDFGLILQQAGRKIQLEPGTAYKIRVCGVNACGAGPWSEVAAFKTTLPGYPGAPSAIKITKGPDGAHLTWEPPGGNSGQIMEYAVYLAVRSASQGSQPVSTTPSQLAFVRVFCGPTNKCVVGPTSLQAAHIDTSTKPAIIFRIAARNDKGYGPATQVRWLQESAQGPNPPTAGVKRPALRVV